MAETKKLNVIKIPNESTSDIAKAQNFPRMPRMYLELLENKEKVKPQLLNKEYDPNDAESVLSFDNEEQDPFKSNLDVVEEDDEYNEEESQEEEEDDDNSDKMSSLSGSAVSNDEDSLSKMNDELSSTKSSIFEDNEKTSDNSSIRSHKSEAREKLKEILKDDDFVQNAPKLSDLQYSQKKNVPNIDQMAEAFSPEEEEDLKRELLFKFELLKKSYKIDIPEFSIHSSLKKMNESYENLLRHVSLDSSVESYKNILIGGFMLFEFILGQWMKFDMSGFTQQQILNMSQYERLLIELGEKSYVPEGKQWPVEVRLLGMIIMNAVIFIVSKMIMKRTGSDLMGMMNHFKPSVQQATNMSSEPKKKMRGPSIDIEI